MEIILHNEKAQYETGQKVSGVLKIGSDSKTAHVKIELGGDAVVDWVEMPVTGMYGSVAVNPDLIFHEDKCCLDLVHEVFDPETINCGEVPFEFTLPNCGTLPSSFKNETAKIVYRIIATVNTDDGQTRQIKRTIQVMSPIKTKLMVYVANTVEKDFGLLSLGSGRIILHANLKRKGFCQGDNIELHCAIWNMSSVECTPRATLYQTQVYLCEDRQKACQLAIGESVIGERVDQNIYDKQIITIAIPREISLSIKSEIIVIIYFIHITVDIPHAFDIHLNLPIVVTTKSAIDEQKKAMEKYEMRRKSSSAEN